MTSYDIWNNHPEKVFAVTRNRAQCNLDTHTAVVKALLEACVWLDDPTNRPETCEQLSLGHDVNVPTDVLDKSLTGTLLVSYVSGFALTRWPTSGDSAAPMPAPGLNTSTEHALRIRIDCESEAHDTETGLVRERCGGGAFTRTDVEADTGALSDHGGRRRAAPEYSRITGTALYGGPVADAIAPCPIRVDV